MRRLVSLLGRALLWGLISVVSLLASVLMHVSLPITRRVAAASLGELVSNEIKGTLVVTHLEKMSLTRIAARDVMLFDGNGRLIIKADRLVLMPDLTALGAGQVRFASARLRGGEVHLIDEGEGLPSLLTTFDAEVPSLAESGEPIEVVIDGVELSYLTLEGDLLGLRGLRAIGLKTGGRLQISDEVHVRIDRAQATLVEPFGFPVHVDALTGTISTVATEGVDLRTRTHRNGERANAHVRYAARDKAGPPTLSVDVKGQALTVDTLHGLGFEFVPELALPVSGEVRLRGPIEDLKVQGQLTTDAGSASLEGSIAEARGVSITMRTDSLRIGRLFSDFPSVTARGLLRIETTTDETADPRFHAEVEPLVYDTIAVPGFSADGAFTSEGVRIDSLQSRSPGTRIEGRGRIYEDGGFEFEAHANIAEVSREPNLARFLPEARGRLVADVEMKSLKAGLATLMLQGRLVLHDTSYGLVSAKRLELRGSVRGDPERPRLRIVVRGDDVRLGEYVLGDPTFSLQGGPREYQAEGEFVSAGQRTMHLNAKVTAEAGGFVIDADTLEFAVGKDSWRGAVQGLRVVSDQAVELGLLRLANRSQRLEARGILRFHGDDQLDAQLQDFDLAAVNALLGDRFWLKQGRVDATVALEGELGNPDLRMQGAIRNAVFREVTGINALYFLAYKDGEIKVDGEVDCAARGLLRLHGGGRIDPKLQDPKQALLLGAYDLELIAERLSFSLLPPAMRKDILGAIEGSVRFSGTLQNPNLEGQFELNALTFPGVSPLNVWVKGGYNADDLKARVTVSDERGALLGADVRMQVAFSALRDDPGAITRTFLQGPWQISGTAMPRRLDQLPSPANQHLPYPVLLASTFDLQKSGGTTSGTIDFNATSEGLIEGACGEAEASRVTGRLSLDQGTSLVEAVLLLGAEQLATFRVKLDTPVDRFIAEGRMAPPKSLRASGRVKIANIERLPFLCEYGSGTLQAELELDGGLSVEPKLHVTLDSTFLPRGIQRQGRRNIQVRSCEGDAMQLHLNLDADSRNLLGAGRLNGCGGGPTTLSASLPLFWQRLGVLPGFRRDAPISLLGRFEGAQLKPLLDRIPGVLNAYALARGLVTVTGSIDTPRFAGSLNIENGRLYLIATGQELNTLHAGLSFHGNWVKLQRLDAKQGKGSLAASGGIALEGLWPQRARIALRTDELPIKREGLDVAWLKGSAAIDADIGSERLRAAIKLHSLRVRLPDTLNRTLQPLEAHPDVAVVTDKPEVQMEPYPVELVIDGSRGIKVVRNDFNATVTTKLAASYENPDLRLAGTIRFEQGDFSVFGKRFDIQNGRLHFHGATEINPDIYLLATQRPEAAGASPVTALVTGTLNEPIVTFSSDACPGEVGAITYLVSGQCAADDPNLVQESADAQSAFTTGVVGGVLTLGTLGKVGGLSPRLAFENAAGGSERVKLGVSSETLVPAFMRGFVRRVYVQGGVSTAGDQATGTEQIEQQDTSASLDFLLELYFAYNIVASGRFGQETWGLDVIWEP